MQKTDHLHNIGKLIKDNSVRQSHIYTVCLRGGAATVDGESLVVSEFDHIMLHSYRMKGKTVYLCPGGLSLPCRLGLVESDFIQVGGLVDAEASFCEEVYQEIDKDLNEILSWHIPCVFWLDENSLDILRRSRTRFYRYIEAMSSQKVA